MKTTREKPGGKTRQEIGVEQQYLNEREVAIIYNVSLQTLRGWRCQRKGPDYVKIGRMVRYEKDSLDTFFKNRTIRLGRN